MVLRIKQNIKPEMQTKKTNMQITDLENGKWYHNPKTEERNKWDEAYDEGNLKKEIIQEKFSEMKNSSAYN